MQYVKIGRSLLLVKYYRNSEKDELVVVVVQVVVK
jgi:hypothetical protein